MDINEIKGDSFQCPIYEGFPITMIEAQAAGLPCVVSDSISKETNLTDEVEYVSLDAGVEKWGEAIRRKSVIRVDKAVDILENKGYDISSVTAKVEKICITA